MTSSPRTLIKKSTLSLTLLLKSNGYKKRGNSYTKQITESGSALGIRSSRWNGADYAEFGIELGVYFPEITRRSIDVLGRNHKLVETLTTVNQCTWTEDIGFLSGEKIQSSWEVCNERSPEEIDLEIKNLVEDIGLPWIDKNSSLEHFLDWLTVKGGRGAGEILWLFNREQEAYRCFSKQLADKAFPWQQIYPKSFISWIHEYKPKDS